MHELIPILTAEGIMRDEQTHSVWASAEPEPQRHSDESHPEAPIDLLPEQPHSPFQRSPGTTAAPDRRHSSSEATANLGGPTLFQDMFFFCTVKKIADLPGSGCIYVETVVDRDSGVSFAKIYPTKNALNAVDILASRVLPFFKRQGMQVKEIHTRNTTEYCGLPPVHAFEAFLVTSGVRHLSMNETGHPCNYLCEEFYRDLLKEFFPTALRKSFPVSLRELQKDLDAFVAAYNESRLRRPLIQGL